MSAKGRAVVWGAGAWGTALARHLASIHERVALWVFEKEQFDSMTCLRENAGFLPGVKIPENVELFHDPESPPWKADVWLSATPTQPARALWKRIGRLCPEGTLVISASKGIENKTLLFVSTVIEEYLPEGCRPVVALSGPSFARGMANGDPTAVVLAAPEITAVRRAQRFVSSPPLRGYAGTDRIGVELGGAAKNVIAVACGIGAGLGFGPNTIAALITRGLREIIRLGLAVGAVETTFSGLSGLGDLALTCTGPESRNRTVGVRLGRGESLEEILGSVQSVAEGVPTTRSIGDLARSLGLTEMPITFTVERILFEGLSPSGALHELLGRTLKTEMD